MPKPMRRLLCKFGQRGAVLLNLGAIWALLGIIDHLEPEVPSDAAETVGLFHAHVPHWWTIWLVAGLAAIVAAFYRRARRDVWGFIALGVPPFLQSMSYAWASFVWLLSGGGVGFGLGVLVAIGWGLIALLPYLLAGWAEPADRNGSP